MRTRSVPPIGRLTVTSPAAVNPCVGIKLPKRNRGQVVPLTPEAVDAMANEAPDRFRAIILFAAGTGLRQGECFGLTVDRVDFLRNELDESRSPGATALDHR